MVALTLVGGLIPLLAYGVGGLFVHPRPKLALAGRMGIVLVAIGAFLAVALFIFISDTSVFGIHCYHTGSLSLSTVCIKPPIYRGAWVLAAALIGSGLWMEFKPPRK